MCFVRKYINLHHIGNLYLYFIVSHHWIFFCKVGTNILKARNTSSIWCSHKKPTTNPNIQCASALSGYCSNALVHSWMYWSVSYTQNTCHVLMPPLSKKGCRNPFLDRCVPFQQIHAVLVTFQLLQYIMMPFKKLNAKPSPAKKNIRSMRQILEFTKLRIKTC